MPQRLLPLVLTGATLMAALLVLAWRLRPVKEPRLTAIERQIVALVPAYFGGSLTLLLLNLFLAEPIPLAPIKAVLSGMAFMTLGATVWGWCYVWGAFFFLLAIVVTFCAVGTAGAGRRLAGVPDGVRNPPALDAMNPITAAGARCEWCRPHCWTPPSDHRAETPHP